MATTIYTNIGRRLRALRQARELSQFRLGAKSDVHPTLISGAECGRLCLNAAQIRRLARALGVRPADLLEEPPA